MNLIVIFYLTLCTILTNKNVLSQNKLNSSTKIERVQVTTKASDSNRNDMETIETAKDFLFKNGYDILEKDFESTVKFEKFQSMKSFNQNKAIQNTLK